MAVINDDLLDVARRMRARDRAEVFAVMPQFTTRDWVDWINGMPGIIELVRYRGELVAAMGGIRIAPHLASMWMIGTDGLKQAGARIATHRAALRLHRAVDYSGVTRCQATPWAGNLEARLWLIALGYHMEGTHPGMGYGEMQDFVTYGRVIHGL